MEDSITSPLESEHVYIVLSLILIIAAGIVGVSIYMSVVYDQSWHYQDWIQSFIWYFILGGFITFLLLIICIILTKNQSYFNKGATTIFIITGLYLLISVIMGIVFMVKIPKNTGIPGEDFPDKDGVRKAVTALIVLYSVLFLLLVRLAFVYIDQARLFRDYIDTVESKLNDETIDLIIEHDLDNENIQSIP